MAKSLNFSPPPARNGQDAAERVAEFAAGADVHHNRGRGRAVPKSASYGELAFLNEEDQRRINTVNLRMTDREKKALQFLEKTSPYSMHAICMRVVREEIRRLVAERTGHDIGTDGDIRL